MSDLSARMIACPRLSSQQRESCEMQQQPAAEKSITREQKTGDRLTVSVSIAMRLQ